MAWFTPVLGAVGALASSALGGMFNRGSSGSSAEDSLINSMLLMPLQQEYQKQMFDYQQNRLEALYNSAHQREVNDLKAAGLNPILSATGGNGAGSSIASVPDYGASVSAGASLANTRATNKVMVGQALLGLGEKLLDFTVNSQNANSARMKAEADKLNALTNMNNSASQIDLNALQGKYFGAQTQHILDSIKTNEFIRKNYASQSFLNYTTAQNIIALQPSLIELYRANANSTPFKIASGLFDMGLDFLKGYNSSNKTSAKQSGGLFDSFNNFMGNVGKKYFEINQNRNY